MWDVRHMGCCPVDTVLKLNVLRMFSLRPVSTGWACRMFGVGNVGDVGCLRHIMFNIWHVGDVGCSGIYDVWDGECLGCAMFCM